MPTVFTHALVAAAVGANSKSQVRPGRLWAALVVSSILPDVDALGLALGIPYEAALGHRGFSHSLAFALLWSLLLVVVAFRSVGIFSTTWWKLVALFFCVTASHGLLDAMTNGGLGIAFFSPFDSTRYFLPWRPIQVSPIGPGFFFSDLGRMAILSEIKFVWLPVGVVWLGLWVARKAVRRVLD
jgi:inner membrane protein